MISQQKDVWKCNLDISAFLDFNSIWRYIDTKEVWLQCGSSGVMSLFIPTNEIGWGHSIGRVHLCVPKGFQAFYGECMDEMAWNMVCWYIMGPPPEMIKFWSWSVYFPNFSIILTWRNRYIIGVSWHFLENTWKEWSEMWWYADVSWPPPEMIKFWSWSVDFPSFWCNFDLGKQDWPEKGSGGIFPVLFSLVCCWTVLGQSLGTVPLLALNLFFKPWHVIMISHVIMSSHFSKVSSVECRSGVRLAFRIFLHTDHLSSRLSW